MKTDLVDRNDIYTLFPACGIAKLHVSDIDRIPSASAPRANESAMMFVDDKAVALADRKLFVHNLGEVMKQTREGIVSVELDDNELVTITYNGGGTHVVNVNMDSYAAIMRDVSKHMS